MKYFVIFLILIGVSGFGFALGEEISHSMISGEEHYKIEIIGLKDEYSVGEKYSFSFVISGYGYSCANHQASYPDENGNIIHMGAEVLCAPEKSMHEFKFNPLDGKGALGNTGIKKAGTYTITVTFEKPNKYYPTTISKEFRVVKPIKENFNELPPLKQIKSGIKFHNVECKEGLELVYKKADNTSACVTLTTEIELVIRGWAEDNRVLLGCTGERLSKCYPDNTQEYRRALYDYYFGSDEGLPTYKDLDISKMRTINACTSKPTICYGELENGTQVRISCDYPIHGCGVRSFDNYKKVENENNSTNSPLIDCNDKTDPHKEYQCFKDAFSSCHVATVNPEIYTIEGDPIYTTLTISTDCKIHGIADMSTDRFWGTPEIISTQCDEITRNEYGWSVINCDANNLPEMQFNFEMQLYPQILECEENDNTWVRESLECVGD